MGGGASLHSYLNEFRQTIMLVMSELLYISLFHPFNGFEFFFTDTCSNYLYNLQMIDIFLKELRQIFYLHQIYACKCRQDYHGEHMWKF